MKIKIILKKKSNTNEVYTFIVNYYNLDDFISQFLQLFEYADYNDFILEFNKIEDEE